MAAGPASSAQASAAIQETGAIAAVAASASGWRLRPRAPAASSAVEELVTNAVEAMPDGGRLGVRLYRDTLTRPLVTPWLVVSPGAYVVVSVADAGHGMTADCVTMACDPFYSTKPAHVGGGLGLASVHGFVAAHHGGIAIDSAPGEGTTVRLYLPAAAAPAGLL